MKNVLSHIPNVQSAVMMDHIHVYITSSVLLCTFIASIWYYMYICVAHFQLLTKAPFSIILSQHVQCKFDTCSQLCATGVGSFVYDTCQTRAKCATLLSTE